MSDIHSDVLLKQWRISWTCTRSMVYGARRLPQPSETPVAWQLRPPPLDWLG